MFGEFGHGQHLPSPAWSRIANLGRKMTFGLCLVSATACGTSGQQESAIVDTSPETRRTLEEASRVSVFFSHQSVGENILSGLYDVSQRTGTSWRIVKLAPTEGHWPTEPGLWHAMLGENEKPKSKIDAFARALRTWSGNKPRLAFLKLCFVDVTETTDIADLLQYYRARMTELKTEFPEVSFGHVTVPLAPQSSTLKATIKRAIGRRIPEDVANVARTRYNAQLRALFANEPIFDLEEVESTRADGTKVQLATASGPAVGLAPEFASDGWGHLNERGAARAAFALAKFLVSSTQPAAVTQNRSTGAAQ